MKLDLDFYERNTVTVARGLLGKVLVLKRDGVEMMGRIIETEAYRGVEDKACHASWRKRSSCETLWGPAGHSYVYLTYGVHYMLNLVTEREDFPSAVLVRAAKPVKNIDSNVEGPGRLTKAFGVDRSFDGKSLISEDFYVADLGFAVKSVGCSPRVGIDYAAEPWKSIKWRFFEEW